MKLRCKACKKRFPPPARGRRPEYCSAACRQKAYRQRQAGSYRKPMALLTSDLYKVKDITARCRAAVKVLEEAGYVVTLERRTTPRPKPKTRLKLISDPGS